MTCFTQGLPLCPRGARALGDRSGDAWAGRPAFRLDAGHRRELRRARAETRSRAAEVAVPYRGYWFYIASDDVKSRVALAILEIVFGLQESDGKNVGPLLTLPVGG